MDADLSNACPVKFRLEALGPFFRDKSHIIGYHNSGRGLANLYISTYLVHI